MPNNEVGKNISHILILSISYALLGRLALLLAIPPGYATAIFPSAGIAVAALLIWGNKLWPGIFLGSLLLNTWIGLEQGNLSALGTIVAVSASVGASIQALLGAWLVSRILGLPVILGKERDIFLFMLLAGPLACIVNASFGSTSLFLTGIISSTDYLKSWFTWWTGDVFGIWIAAPLVFIAFAKPANLWRSRCNSIAIPVVILLAAVITLFIWMSKWELDRAKSDFNEVANDTAYELRNNFDNYIDGVNSIERFFISSSNVTRKEFRDFVKKMLASKPALHGVSWNPLIQDSQRTYFENRVRKEGLADFEIKERSADGKLVRAAKRDHYVVVNYIEPLAGNASALGFDVASNSERLKALNKARDSGEAVATSRITLVQASGKQAGILLFLPVYKGAAATVEQRRNNLAGYAVGVFRVADIIEEVLDDFHLSKIQLNIFDKTDSVDAHLYGQENNKQFTDTRFKWEEELDIGGRKWSVTIYPTKNYLTTFSEWRAWSILASGCFFISMLTAFLLAMTGYSYQVESLVARRTAELSGIVNSAIEAIMTTDEKGIIESVNPATEELLGFTSGELLGRPIDKFIPDFFVLSDNGTAKVGEKGNRWDTFAIRKDSSSVPVELAVSTLSLSDKIHYTAIIHDLTERTKTNRMKDEFISTVSHELRTPLTSIKGSMGLILGGVIEDDPVKKKSMLDIAYQNVERLEVLINDLLDFNKFQSAGSQLEKEKLNINSLLDKAVELNQGFADKYHVSYIWDPSEESNVNIYADEHKLMQVLYNLLSNAVKYSPRESEVIISASVKDDSVRVSISDSGPGIPADFHDKVFEQFTQVDSSDTRRVGGTGLGLAITRVIIEKHDGRIGFDTTEGEGTTFYFELPVLK